MAPADAGGAPFARTALISVAFAVFFGVTQLASARPLLDFANDAGPTATSTFGHGVLTRIDRADRPDLGLPWAGRGRFGPWVNSTTFALANRRGGDAVHLEPGRTGHIGRLDVVTSVADGVKVAEGVHDLAVGGGTIRCQGKVADVHQDGMQVMGGTRITFRGLRIDCGRSEDSLINSNRFIKRSGRSVNPPADVICVDCSLAARPPTRRASRTRSLRPHRSSARRSTRS